MGHRLLWALSCEQKFNVATGQERDRGGVSRGLSVLL